MADSGDCGEPPSKRPKNEEPLSAAAIFISRWTAAITALLALRPAFLQAREDENEKKMAYEYDEENEEETEESEEAKESEQQAKEREQRERDERNWAAEVSRVRPMWTSCMNPWGLEGVDGSIAKRVVLCTRGKQVLSLLGDLVDSDLYFEEQPEEQSEEEDLEADMDPAQEEALEKEYVLYDEMLLELWELLVKENSGS